MPPKINSPEKVNKFPPISPQSAGMEDSNSGRPTCRSRPLLRHTRVTFKPSPFHPMTENMLPPEEETENFASGMSLTCLPPLENLMPRLKLTRLHSIPSSNGLLLPLNPESKSGIWLLFLLILSTLFCPMLLLILKSNNLLIKNPKT